MSSKSVLQECQVRSALQECQVRSVLQECQVRVSSRPVSQEVQECQVRVSYKSVKQEVSYKNVKQECLTRALRNSVKQGCPTRVSPQCVNSGCLTSEFAGIVTNKVLSLFVNIRVGIRVRGLYFFLRVCIAAKHCIHGGCWSTRPAPRKALAQAGHSHGCSSRILGGPAAEADSWMLGRGPASASQK